MKKFPLIRLLPLLIASGLPAAVLAQPEDAAARQAAAASTLPADDAMALATLAAINAHEVAAAELALSKAAGAPVQGYAAKMKREHSANAEQTRALAQRAGIAPAENAAVRQLERASAEKHAALESRTGTAFEKAYMQAMVEDHTEALARIDGSLLPNARNAEVAAHLRKTREHVQQHLDEARKLMDSLASTADSSD